MAKQEMTALTETPAPTRDLEAALATFVAGCQTILDRYHADSKGSITYKVEHKRGKRYEIVQRAEYAQDGREITRSGHCFVDLATGDVLKCASWKVPAKGARGNIFNTDNGLGCMGPYGAAYKR